MNDPKGYLALTLHAHLPFVRHPEYEFFLEEDWLYEAITETYIPLYEMFDGLERDGAKYKFAMSITPSLMSMLKDELLQSRYVREIEKLIELAEKEVERTKKEEYLKHQTAQMYLDRFRRSRYIFCDVCRNDLVSGFKRFMDSGNLEIITCGATHGFLPLLSLHKPSVRAQIRVAVDHYRENLGRGPRGIWLPECAYTPGVDRELALADIRYFFMDSHGLLYATPKPVYGVAAPLFTPYGVAAFGRDPESSKQVWSAIEGYPGDVDYREFYRDIGYDREYDYIRPYLPPTGERKNTGIKYCRITGKVDLAHKQLYDHKIAAEKAAMHAGNFMFNRQKQVEWLRGKIDRKPLIVSPYDAELFGHWWFEGPQFLNYLIRKIAYDQTEIALTHPWEYLNNFPTNQMSVPAASSWGAKGGYEVWLEGSNHWIWRPLINASIKMTELADDYATEPFDDLTRRALKQAAREILLAQSSDWPFIMKTATMVEYAIKRVKAHLGRFAKLYEQIKANRIDPEFLSLIEAKDNIFANINYHHFETIKD